MRSKEGLRQLVWENLAQLVCDVNYALRGKKLRQLKPVLERIGRNQELPHWYDVLATKGTLPNLDGKTIGSVVEMLFVAVLETTVFANGAGPKLSINPASGVDLPDLDLGVKAPSENFCTSEPFFSAYERLHGGEYDVLVMLTDYQQAKKRPPLRLQIKDSDYLLNHEIADNGLCSIAIKHREWLLADNESRAKKVFRFLAYVNQAKWLGKRLVDLIKVVDDEDRMIAVISTAKDSFEKHNATRTKSGKDLLPEEDLRAIVDIRKVSPLYVGVIEAADNWVAATYKDFARLPNENEWKRLRNGPLDGKIGMSYALQWRYNFGPLFRNRNKGGSRKM